MTQSLEKYRDYRIVDATKEGLELTGDDDDDDDYEDTKTLPKTMITEQRINEWIDMAITIM